MEEQASKNDATSPRGGNITERGLRGWDCSRIQRAAQAQKCRCRRRREITENRPMRFNVRDDSVSHGQIVHAQQTGEWRKVLHRLYVRQSSGNVRLTMLT